MTLTTVHEAEARNRREYYRDQKEQRRLKRTLLHALADQVHVAVFHHAPTETIEALLADMRTLVEG